ncbi:hypothetical protein BHE74_00023990 [Ensete ventricosum]|nr:hypothetical protein BHE74_00023990 [Ensete ventricosum]
MSRRPCIDASVAASRVALQAVARSGHLGTECSDVLCRVAAAIVRLEGRESEGPPSGPRQASDGLGGLVLSGNRRCWTIDYRSWARIEPDRRSDFATELAPKSGRLRKLSRLGAVAVPFQAGPPRLGATGDSVCGCACLDLASEAEESLGRDDERSRVGGDSPSKQVASKLIA